MKDIGAKNVHKILGDRILADGMDIVLDMEKSQGSYIYDSISGKKFLDFFTCFASMPIGYNHPAMDDDFVMRIGKVALNKPSNSDLYTEEYASFVENFFDKAVPSYFVHSFYISGGALAVENAMKAAFDWKKRLNLQKGLSSDLGDKVIYLNEAFHGRSGYTLSVTNTLPDKVMLFPRFNDWIKVTNPKMIHPMEGQNLEDVISAEKQSISQIEKAISDHPNDISCILIEPIQGEGGDNHFRIEYLKELRRIADENDILLIYDEVQTGGGLTGSFWVHEQLDVRPDILAFGKKMQVCGILATERLDLVEDNVFRKSSRINSTWGGNLVDMVRVNKYLDIIYAEDMLQNSSRLGQILLSELQRLSQDYPTLVSNPRGRGLFAAFDIDYMQRQQFLDHCKSAGLLILKCGKQSIRFRPPLNLSEAELREGIDIIDSALAKLRS